MLIVCRHVLPISKKKLTGHIFVEYFLLFLGCLNARPATSRPENARRASMSLLDGVGDACCVPKPLDLIVCVLCIRVQKITLKINMA